MTRSAQIFPCLRLPEEAGHADQQVVQQVLDLVGVLAKELAELLHVLMSCSDMRRSTRRIRVLFL